MDNNTIFGDSICESEKEFVTEFEKDCIARISELCAKKKRYCKIRRGLLAVSGAFCFLAALFLAISLFAKNKKGGENKLLSLLSIIASTLSIISGWHSERIAQNEIEASKDIAFFEDAIEDAEDICD